MVYLNHEVSSDSRIGRREPSQGALGLDVVGVLVSSQKRIEAGSHYRRTCTDPAMPKTSNRGERGRTRACDRDGRIRQR